MTAHSAPVFSLFVMSDQKQYREERKTIDNFLCKEQFAQWMDLLQLMGEFSKNLRQYLYLVFRLWQSFQRLHSAKDNFNAISDSIKY